MWSRVVAGVVTAFAVSAVSAPVADAQTIKIREGADHETEASVVVDATPHEIYSLVTDYANWQSVFSDVLSVKLEAGGREDGRVRFKSRILDSTVTVQFKNVADHKITFVGIKGPPGGKAHGSYVFTPIGDGSQTLVTARFYLDVDGIGALFVREKRLRRMRHAKLAADMRDAVMVLARLRQPQV